MCSSECHSGYIYIINAKMGYNLLCTILRPKRLRSNRKPENLKPQVQEQIQELLKLGIIKPSESAIQRPESSPSTAVGLSPPMLSLRSNTPELMPPTCY